MAEEEGGRLGVVSAEGVTVRRAIRRGGGGGAVLGGVAETGEEAYGGGGGGAGGTREGAEHVAMMLSRRERCRGA